MRVLKQQGRMWGCRDMVALCECGKRSANAYIAALVRHGYVAVIERAYAGRGARYRLVRDTGPQAPRTIRATGGLWDPNTGEVREP